jgi:hypothetical protein
MIKIVQPRDLEELLQWVEEAQERHPQAKIDHVEQVILSAGAEREEGGG